MKDRFEEIVVKGTKKVQGIVGLLDKSCWVTDHIVGHRPVKKKVRFTCQSV